MSRSCSFIGHRKIEVTDNLKNHLYSLIEKLIVYFEVKYFLFGSKSQFNDLCYDIVMCLQSKYPSIITRFYNCSNEYGATKAEKTILDKQLQDITNNLFSMNYYDEVVPSKHSGKAQYIKRNYDLINDSDFCVFYFDSNYIPPLKKRYKRDVLCYQPKSGTSIAYQYALKQNKSIFNVFRV